ncbi:MAG: hypothetical protein WAO21_11620, partial [Verrucomicrobiia bacterium]
MSLVVLTFASRGWILALAVLMFTHFSIYRQKPGGIGNSKIGGKPNLIEIKLIFYPVKNCRLIPKNSGY